MSPKRHVRVAGLRPVVVTGGASGIGFATAAMLARRGWHVYVVGRREHVVKAATHTLRADGGLATAIAADVSTALGRERVVATVRHEFGRLDALVNAAGSSLVAPFVGVTPEDLRGQFIANVETAYFMTQAAMPLLVESAQASVVNISSTAASLSVPGQSAYGMAKAALEFVTRSLAAELAPLRIRVNAVAPGATDTPIHGSVAEARAAELSRFVDKIPLGRLGRPDDIATWIVHLVEDASWVTGVVLPIDGGRVLHADDLFDLLPAQPRTAGKTAGKVARPRSRKVK